MLSGLLSILNGKWLTHCPEGVDEGGMDVSWSAIRVNTSRLPRAFREKFRLGGRMIKQDEVDDATAGNATYKVSHVGNGGDSTLLNGVIDESEGDIRIMCFDLAIPDQVALVEAVSGKEKDGNRVESFLKNLTKRQELSENSGCGFVMYLEVGDGIYWRPERFERLIIAHDGEIKKNLVCGKNKILRNGEDFDPSAFLWGKFEAKMKNIGVTLLSMVRVVSDYCISDDDNIQNELKTNCEFCDAFYRGGAKIIVYHRAVQSLTLLCFEQHDERVAAIDRKRCFFLRSKSVVRFAIFALIFYIADCAFTPIPLLGGYLGIVCRFVATVTAGMAFYKGYQLLPTRWRTSVSSFISKKIISRLSVWFTQRKQTK
ncbi:MAG: hypothetical protein LBD60_00645 [Puniceicoccales bacterium]|jgi:hypothetical protein|nr:hypothetical protein [Puniceicoccales bacterium]